MNMSPWIARSVGVAAIAALSALAQGQLNIVSTSPPQNAGNVARGAPLVVNFDRPVNPATFIAADFYAFGRWSGPVVASPTFSNGNQTVTLTPPRPFMAGEQVLLIMSRNLRAADGSAMRSAGYTMTYSTGVAPTRGVFSEITRFSDRSPNNAQTRIYGGVACDLNMDGWADLSIINEVSGDIRVFMNRADGSALFHPFLTPPTPVPLGSSPNEPGDFNRDGFVDIVTASNEENRMAIAWGNGDGTFDPPTVINAGSYSRGLGVLDADGDGDLDIALACTSANRIELYLNNGVGVFSAPSFIEAGGSGEYGLAAADMNNDGILDLAVGCTNSQTVCVLRGNGNASFTSVACRSVGGPNWVLVCGDLNGDRLMDVASANSGAANAGVLLGNGDGTLRPVTTYPVAGHTPGVDLSDFEGDGDLDMIVSSFSGNRWHFFRNNGLGAFTELAPFMAPANPACALPADLDNDGDVDLVLLDEIADVVILLENVGGGACNPDLNQDGNTDQDDVAYLINVVGGGPNPTGIDPDFNRDGNADQDDIAALINVVAGGACP
jgi:hypothetical protein